LVVEEAAASLGTRTEKEMLGLWHELKEQYASTLGQQRGLVSGL
jgi:hypothetical protein